MERDRKNRITRYILYLITVAFFGSLLALTGCATIRIPSDSPYRKVKLENRTPYELELTGAVTGTLEPNGVRYERMECVGRFEGIAYAWLIHGQTEDGSVAKEYMGESRYSFSVDNRPRTYEQETLDARFVFHDNFRIASKVFGGRKKSRFLPGLYHPCSILLPTVTFEWGK